MNYNDLKPGLRLELILLNDRGEWAGGPFVTQLLEPIAQGKAVIAVPIHRSVVLVLPHGARIRLSFLHDKLGLLTFTAVVEAGGRKENIDVMTLSSLGEIEIRQRRTHYRLPVCLPFTYRPDEAKDARTSEPSNSQKPPFRTAYTKNISGSGFCVVLNEVIEEDLLLEIHLVLDEGSPLRGLAKVTRSIPIRMNGRLRYQTGLQTVEMSGKDEDRLFKFIYRQQRMLLYKDAPAL